MNRSLTSRTTLESLKKDAKQWLKTLRAGHPKSQERLLAALPDNNSRDVTLRVIQHALAREYGFAGWHALLEALNDPHRELREVANEMLKHAVFKGDPAVATRLFMSHPDVAKLDLFTAVAAGDLENVKRFVTADVAAASRAGGPLGWSPILYLTYMRLPGSAPHSVEIARILLDHGADPNSRWDDGWGNAFTALTGVIALGEGLKPPHERADELAELLLQRDADPFDSQAFYNTSIAHDDPHWLEVLWSYSARRNVTEKWRAMPSPIGGKYPTNPLDFMLGLAVSHNHLRRAEWLLGHGASAGGRHPYSGRQLNEEAVAHGFDAMAALLARHGAAAAPLQGKAAFRASCRMLDRNEARRLCELNPGYLHDAELLLLAAEGGRLDIVELLLDLGMPVDIEDDHGVRALHLAAGNGAVDVMKVLIQHGADVDRPTNRYDGPLGFAAHFNQRGAAQLLAPLSKDVHTLVFLGFKDRLRELFTADPQLVNLVHARTGVTPLFTLPQDESAAVDMARFLIQHGANARVRDSAGATPADAARKLGFNAVAELLSQKRQN